MALRSSRWWNVIVAVSGGSSSGMQPGTSAAVEAFGPSSGPVGSLLTASLRRHRDPTSRGPPIAAHMVQTITSPPATWKAPPSARTPSIANLASTVLATESTR